MAQGQGERSGITRNKHLERACKHVTDLWFPVNIEFFRKIREGIRSGRFSSDVKPLINELKTDLSLFTYCLRELLLVIKATEGAVPVKDPLALFEDAGVEALSRILNVESAAISRHSFEVMSPSQNQRINETMITATTAEVLSEHTGLPGSTGFTAGLMRQLGHTLIAWNYPTVFERAMTSVQEGEDLDLAIARVLGFTPALLATTLVQSWGLAPEICAAIGESTARTEDMEGIGQKLAKLCDVGQKLARANNPELYPTAVSDWNTAVREIESHLGPDGMKIIRDRLAENCRNYAQQIPKAFQGKLAFDPEARIKSHRYEELARGNTHISQCDDRTQKQLQAFYEVVAKGEEVQKVLRLLLHQVLPTAKFTGTCVYTIDPATSMLIPQINIGRLRLRGPIPASYTPHTEATNFIAQAFDCGTPIVQSAAVEASDGVAAIAGGLGTEQRIGVLYVEIPATAYSANTQLALTHFRACAQALVDCLGVK